MEVESDVLMRTFAGRMITNAWSLSNDRLKDSQVAEYSCETVPPKKPRNGAEDF